MKKRCFVAAVLALALCFSGCGTKSSIKGTQDESTASSEPTSSVVSEEESLPAEESSAAVSEAESKVNKIDSMEESVAPESEIEEEPESEELEFVTVNIGDKIENDFVSMTIEGGSISQELYPEDDGSHYFLSGFADQEDEQYFYIYGSLKNLAGSEYRADRMVVTMKFNDKYEYRGQVEFDDGDGDFYGYEIKPLKSATFYIMASIPDEVIEAYEKCEIKFAFNDEFEYDYSSDFADYTNRYTITLEK